VSSVRLFRECPSCAATCVTGTPSAIFTLALAWTPAPERPYSARPSRGVRSAGPFAFRCFDLAEGDPELALLLAVTAVRLGYPADDPAVNAASSVDSRRGD
jgi:hypothetical protein